MSEENKYPVEESNSDIIERFERETGQRFDANGGDNATMAGLFGMLARALGKSSHDKRDDVAAGYLIRHQGTPEYRQEEETKALMAEMLRQGLSPNDLGALFGKEKT